MHRGARALRGAMAGGAVRRSVGSAHRPAPRREASSVATRLRFDRRPDCRVALCMRIEHEARPVRRWDAPGTRCATATASSVTSGSCCADEGRFELRVQRAVDVDREPALLDQGRTSTGDRAGSTRAPGTRSGTPRRGRTRGDSDREVAVPRVAIRARRFRLAERHPGAPFALHPRRSRCRAGRASGTRAGRPRGHATAREPFRRSRTGRGLE